MILSVLLIGLGLLSNMITCKPGLPNQCAMNAACVQDQNHTSYYYCLCVQTSEPQIKDSKCDVKKASNKEPVIITDIHVKRPLNGFNVNGIIKEAIDIKVYQPTTILPTSTSVSTSTSVPSWPSASHFVTGVPMLTFFGIIVLMIILCILWRILCCGCDLRMQKKDKNKPLAIQLGKNVLVEERYTTNPQYTSASETADILSIGIAPILNRNCITDLFEVGEGFFGKVYRGHLHTIDNEEEHVEMVAVKMLKQTVSLEAEEDFMREVEIMSSFHHPNILILIGVCPRENTNPPWMVFEFMPFGDLADVLRNSNNPSWRSVTALPTLNAKALLSISSQIASGMEYLASQRFVHRDLACRNCLVGSSLIVKISDFGMSRDVYTCEYYRIGGNRKLPVKWMSPESISYGKFTLESDIWSYGVVLWEIYSYGKQPYYGHTNEEALKFILSGILLDIPAHCPEEVGEIMKLCWKKESKERIQFLEICNRLSKLKESMSNFVVPTLPRPPPLPVTIDYPTTFEDEPDDNLDEDNYLRPKSPPSEIISNDDYLVTIP